LVQNDAKGNLFCIYTRLLRNETRCYFIYYNNQPCFLVQTLHTVSTVRYYAPNFDGHADSNGDFHLIWVEKAGIEY
jgi:hypothetical protein